MSTKDANPKGRYLYKNGNDPKGISIISFARLFTSRFLIYSIEGNVDASEIIFGALNSSFKINETATTTDGSKFFLATKSTGNDMT